MFGLKEYQATLTGSGHAGIQALSHAVDRLSVGKIQRLAIGAVTYVTPELAPILQGVREDVSERIEVLELAVVFCLEAKQESPQNNHCTIAQEWVFDENDVLKESPSMETVFHKKDEEVIKASMEKMLEDVPKHSRGLAAPALLGVLRLADNGERCEIKHENGDHQWKTQLTFA